MATAKTQIRKWFPNLKPTDYKETSKKDDNYNCIGWALGDKHRFWWPWGKPPYYWPPGLPLDPTLNNFVAAFATVGYSPCDSFAPEEGFEKVVIYVNDQGRPTHAARMVENGRWTSKLGPEEDIEHKTLGGLSGQRYGHPKQALRRPKK